MIDEPDVGDEPTNADQDQQCESSRGEPVFRGYAKIDFNDDKAVSALVEDVVDQYKAAAEAAGLKMAPPGSLAPVSVGGVPYEEYRRFEEAQEGEYRAIVSLVPANRKLGRSEFLAIVDGYVHREITAGGGVWLDSAVASVREALEWAEIDLSGVDVDDGADVVDVASAHLVSFEHDRFGGDALLTLDLGRGVTYVCFSPNPDRDIGGYEVIAEVVPDDWDAVRGHGIDAVRSSLLDGELLGMCPDAVGVSYPLTREDALSTIRTTLTSMTLSDVRLYAQWMSDAGQEGQQLDSEADRVALIDAYCAALRVGGD